jgi:hypothetical protein
MIYMPTSRRHISSKDARTPSVRLDKVKEGILRYGRRSYNPINSQAG